MARHVFKRTRTHSRASPGAALLGRATALIAAAAALASPRDVPAGLDAAAHASSRRPSVQRLESIADLPLRAAGRPGDLLLVNDSTRAVVRQSDGALVDFFRTDASPSTAPALDGLTGIDGLTALRGFLRSGSRFVELRRVDVAAKGNGVEATANVSVSGAELRVTTRYALSNAEAKLVISTRVQHLAGSTLESLIIGERLRWGNSGVFVDDRRAPPTFSGKARRVGRKGAGGDLVLESSPAAGPFRVAFQSTQPGLSGAIAVEYEPVRLGFRAEATIVRSLAYGRIEPAPDAGLTARLEIALADELGEPLAAKLSIRGVRGTADPDFGTDGGLSGANRFVWTGNGRLVRSLRPGRYALLATAGVERDARQWEVSLESGQTLQLTGTLARVIDTPGTLAADLHLHQAASPDADIGPNTRLISIAAEGVEFAVASDHYVVGDLRPALHALRTSGALRSRLLVLPGTEVTTVGNDFGHFNVFPLSAVDGIPHEDTTPRRLFAAVRERAPEALLQVNHPRWRPGGYFQRYRLDPKTARVPASLRDEYATDFDVLEVFNGFDAWSGPIVRGVLRDYLHLIGSGQRYTATGNSDSHGLFFVDPGMPRNLVRYGEATNDAADLDVDPGRVLAGIRRGSVVVTNGPVVDVDVNGIGPGGTVRTAGGAVRLRIRVRAAPWIDVRTVEVLRGGGAERVRSIPVAPSRNVERFDQTVVFSGSSPTFFVVVVTGERPLANVFRDGVRPFAFTNPIYIQP